MAWKFYEIKSYLFLFLPHSFLYQRVNQCLRDACNNSSFQDCKKFLDCGHGNGGAEYSQDQTWKSWSGNQQASDCFEKDKFSYGIYEQAVKLTTENSIITRYVYSLFWGFQVTFSDLCILPIPFMLKFLINFQFLYFNFLLILYELLPKSLPIMSGNFGPPQEVIQVEPTTTM